MTVRVFCTLVLFPHEKQKIALDLRKRLLKTGGQALKRLLKEPA